MYGKNCDFGGKVAGCNYWYGWYIRRPKANIVIKLDSPKAESRMLGSWGAERRANKRPQRGRGNMNGLPEHMADDIIYNRADCQSISHMACRRISRTRLAPRTGFANAKLIRIRLITSRIPIREFRQGLHLQGLTR